MYLSLGTTLCGGDAGYLVENGMVVRTFLRFLGSLLGMVLGTVLSGDVWPGVLVGLSVS